MMLIHPYKRFGQHFLKDEHILQTILEVLQLKSFESVIEIGPGTGALTRYLLPHLNALHVIELDARCVAALKTQTHAHLHIHHQDALTWDWMHFARHNRPLRVVGNLPYCIATPLIFHVLLAVDCIQDLHFMVQKEVALRLSAHPGTSHYGRLSVMTQYFCKNFCLFDVPPHAFSPKPKVESTFVLMKPRVMNTNVVKNFNFFVQLVKKIFQKRRKTIKNALSDIPHIEFFLEKTNILPHWRPQEIGVDQFVLLSNELSEFTERIQISS